MFRGRFNMRRVGKDGIQGDFTSPTPKGDYRLKLRGRVKRHKNPEDTKKQIREVSHAIIGEMLETADLFPLPTLVGASGVSYAKKLYQRMNSGDARESGRAKREFEQIKAKAAAGKSKAQDIVYAVERIQRETRRNGRFAVQGMSSIVIPSSLMGEAHRIDSIKSRAKRGHKDARHAVSLYQGYTRPEMKAKASKAHKALEKAAVKGDPHARKALKTYKKLVKAVRKQKASPAAVMGGGFNFGSFMKNVGGPIMKQLAPVASAVPFVGPILSPAMSIVGDAVSGPPAKRAQAKRKIKRIDNLAKAGVPKAIRAKAGLKAALKIKRAKALDDAIKSGALKKKKKRRKPETRAQKVARILSKRKRLTDYERGVRAGVKAGLRRGRVKVYR